MFVTADDFATLPYKLPGLTAPGAVDDFPVFVANAEEEWLRKLVGNLFYDAMAAGIAALPDDWVGTVDYAVDAQVVYNGAIWKSLVTPNLNHVPVTAGGYWVLNPVPTVDRWLKLRDGENYQVPTVTKCPTYLWVGMERFVTPMIYSLWLKYSTRSNSGQGIVVASMENSEIVSPGLEISRAWRAYNRLAIGTLAWLYYGRYSIKDSFYGYLTAVASDFDDVITDGSYNDFLAYIQSQFCAPGRMNEFDI